MISPRARRNYVGHSHTDQSSILRFIEDNWHLGRLGNQSTDAGAGSPLSMFDFNENHARPAEAESRPVHRQPLSTQIYLAWNADRRDVSWVTRWINPRAGNGRSYR